MTPRSLSLGLLAATLLSACASVPNERPDPAAMFADMMATTEANRMVAELGPVSRSFVVAGSGLALPDAPFRFGDYEVFDISRSSRGHSGVNINLSLVGYASSPFEQLIEYRFSGVEHVWDGQCSYARKIETIAVLGASSERETGQLRCACSQGERQASVLLDDSPISGLSGSMVMDGQRFRLGQHTIGHYSPSLRAFAAGYRVDSAQGPLAAIRTVAPQRLWLRQDMPGAVQEPMACALSGLVLFSKTPAQRG